MIYATAPHACDEQGVSTGWNREHSWPKSYGVGYEGPDYSDLHALYAADWSVNSARNNLFFDNCAGAGCTSPAHSEAEATTAKDSVWRIQPPSTEGERAHRWSIERFFAAHADTRIGCR